MIPTLCLSFEVLFNSFVTLTKMIGNKFNNSLAIGEEKTWENNRKTIQNIDFMEPANIPSMY
jgi:hypothetical protein